MAFGWGRGREPSPSEKWAGSNLPQGPLVQHLTSLHALYLHAGLTGDALEIAEHHLKEIGVFTATRPGWK